MAQLSPYKYTPIFYGGSKQFTVDTDTSSTFDAKVILRVQKIASVLLHYGRAVDKKIIFALSAIGSQQAAAIVDIATSVDQLLNYIAKYPHNSITYRESDIIFSVHSDASYLNKRFSRCRAGSHIFSQKMTTRLHLIYKFSPSLQPSNFSCPQQLNLSSARFSLQLNK